MLLAEYPGTDVIDVFYKILLCQISLYTLLFFEPN